MCRLLKPLDSFPSELSVDTEALDLPRQLDPEDALAYSKRIKDELDVSYSMMNL